ncbi:MAG: ferrous iron transport protein B [Alistipes sp.]|nr:ferrous iron transport protein B [Alistipes sp.]
MRLSELKTGESAIVLKVLGHGGFRRRIVEMGFVRGVKISVVQNAPLKDPIEYNILGYNISLRRSEAKMVVIITEEEAKERIRQQNAKAEVDSEAVSKMIDSRKRHINIALVGNPNSGKTSLFNIIAGAHEHTGNYSGVTVGAKSGRRQYGGYEFHITDLPGTYALSPYSPEELFVRRHLVEEAPDIVLNVVCASNIERNLFLTTELIDMGQPMVIALNMYDELESSGATLDHDTLGKMMGVPMVPVVGRTGRGIEELLDTIVAVYEGNDARVRHIHINQGIMEESVLALHKGIKEFNDLIPHQFPPRYFAIKLLEGDTEAARMLQQAIPQQYEALADLCEREQQHLRTDLGADEDIESAFANQKYGFIAGALRETYTAGGNRRQNLSDKIDSIVIHRIWGYPIFALIMWAMFYCTFSLGKYPQEWIENAILALSEFINGVLPSGILHDLIVDGIIGGVGSVIVFLPNIVILYIFISIMEDSGYLARAAFIMDKVMHKIGLHGKSFIPLIMGFGCNVPAVMASRAIESRSSRIITTMITPFMSCSARLPIYILFIGAFFPEQAGTMLFLLYLGGILMAVVTARLMRRFMFKVDDTPFVMELPPYRMPTAKAVLSHMWERCAQYLRKISGMILVASIIIWFLGYFPRNNDNTAEGANTTHYEESYIGQIGKFCEPVFEPLGLDWKASVSLLSGVAAKEIMVSTMGVLYANGSSEQSEPDSLSQTLSKSNDYTTASSLALLVFALLYTPCIATIAAIGAENGKRWALASIVYSTAVAWLCAYAVYNIAQLIW